MTRGAAYLDERRNDWRAADVNMMFLFVLVACVCCSDRCALWLHFDDVIMAGARDEAKQPHANPEGVTFISLPISGMWT